MSPELFDSAAIYELAPYNELSENLSIWQERYLLTKQYDDELTINTIDSYRYAINTFIQYSKQYDDLVAMNDIGYKFISSFLKSLLRSFSKKAKQNKIIDSQELERKHKRSANHHLTVIKQFLLYISENNKENHDYTLMFKRINAYKVEKPKTEHLTPDEMEELLELMKVWPEVYKEYRPKSSIQYAWRDSLIVMLYCLTGARASEILHVKLEDITQESFEFEGEEITQYKLILRKTKGSKTRTQYILKSEIQKHLDYLKENLPDTTYYLSSAYAHGAYKNTPMSRTAIYRFIGMALRTIGIKKDGTHIIRRGSVTNMIAEGVDISTVGQLHGHESILTTQRYVKENEELKKRELARLAMKRKK